MRRAFSTRSREPTSRPPSFSLPEAETEARFSLTPLVPCSTFPPQSSPPTAQSKPVQIPAPAASHNAHRHAQPALPPAPLPHPRRHLHLLPLPLPLPGPGRGAGASQGGGDGADGHGGRDRVQRRGHERDAAAAGPLPALRALHLLRRAQGRLRPRTVLLRHQLQHPQPPLRVLLIHAKVLRLPRMQPLNRAPLLLRCSFASSDSRRGFGSDSTIQCDSPARSRSLAQVAICYCPDLLLFLAIFCYELLLLIVYFV